LVRSALPSIGRVLAAKITVAATPAVMVTELLIPRR